MGEARGTWPLHPGWQAKPGLWAKAPGVFSASQFPGHTGFAGHVEWLALGCSSSRGSLSASALTQGTVFTGLFTFLDVNECAANTHTCSLHATCLNILGSFKCKCKQGYKGSGLQCSGKYTWPWCLSYSHKAFSPRLLPPFFLPPTLCVWRHGGGEVHTYSV